MNTEKNPEWETTVGAILNGFEFPVASFLIRRYRCVSTKTYASLCKMGVYGSQSLSLGQGS